MAVPQDKTALKQAILTNYAKLKKELSSIPPALVNEKTLVGHAKDSNMSINNLLSYLLGWGQLVLKWIRHKDLGQPVDFPETGYRWNQLGLLAQKFYTDYEDQPYTRLCAHLDQTVAEIVALIDHKTQTELYEMPWYEKWTLGRMIQFNTSSPYQNARARIRKWKTTNLNPDT